MSLDPYLLFFICWTLSLSLVEDMWNTFICSNVSILFFLEDKVSIFVSFNYNEVFFPRFIEVAGYYYFCNITFIEITINVCCRSNINFIVYQLQHITQDFIVVKILL